MRTDDAGTGDQLDELVGYLGWFQGAEPQPLCKLLFGDGLEELMKRYRRVEVMPVAAQVYAGQHDFPEAPPGRTLNRSQGVFRQNTAAAPPGIGNDAVGTEGIAAILHLEKGPGVLGETLQGERFRMPLPGNVRHYHLPVVAQLMDEPGNVPFFTVADHQRDTRHVLQFVGGYLGIAAGDNNPRRGVPFHHPADKAAGLGIGTGRNGTGIDNVDIGGIIESDDGKPFPGKLFRHDGRLELIRLAAESGECHAGQRHGNALSIQPPPRTRSPSYSTTACPGVTDFSCSANVISALPSGSGVTVQETGWCR